MPFPPTHPALARALADKAYLEPTPVQAAVLDERTDGRDLLVSAQTGSGKTVAYGLALASTLLGEADRFERAEAPLALVVAPTRELALQVHRELTWLYAGAKGRVVADDTPAALAANHADGLEGAFRALTSAEEPA
jgi:ATP-dependent RNA helicase DeaD